MNHDQRRLIDNFISSLHDATGLEIVNKTFEVESLNGKLDLLLEVMAPGGSWILAAECIRIGYPRDVRNAVWRLDGLLNIGNDRESVIKMVVAEQLSPGAREELKQRGVGYFDSSGSLYLRHGQWLINIDRKNEQTFVREMGSIFNGSCEMVVHALLLTKNSWFTGLELARNSHTSAYTVSKVLNELEKREWVESKGSGRTQRRRLSKPRDLLDAWAEVWQKRKFKKSRWYLLSSSSKQLFGKLADCAKESNVGDWAFTGAIAANRNSPLLTSVEVAEIEIQLGEKDSFAKTFNLKPAEKGFNVILIERVGASTLFWKQYAGSEVNFVSPYIQYLDLLDGRGRNAELAIQFRKNILEI